MTNRIKWKRNGGRNLIAHLEPDERASRVAEIRYEATSSTKWRWQINYDLAKASGSATTSQAASDAANNRLEAIIAEAADLAAVAAKEDALATLVRRQVEVGDLPLSAFEIEGSDDDRLQFIIDTVRHGRGIAAPIPRTAATLVQAVSEELYRRRIAKDKEPGPRG